MSRSNHLPGESSVAVRKMRFTPIQVGASLLTFLCFSLLTAGPAVGQPDWVKQAVESSSSYEADPDAPAVYLWKTASVEFKPGGQSKRLERVAIKVLTQQGIPSTYLTEQIGEDCTVKDLKGWLIDRTGKCHKLEKKYIAEVALDNAAGYYDDMRQLVAFFPDAGTGDVVAYEYVIEEKGGWEAYCHFFEFQVSDPVVYAGFDVTIPDGWQYSLAGRNLDDVVHKVKGWNLSWSYTNLGYRPEEPLMPPWRYVSRTLLFAGCDPEGPEDEHFSDWRSISRWGASTHAEPAVPDSSLARHVNQLVGSVDDPWDKFCGIAEYVRDQIRYVAVELGEGRFRPRRCTETWSNRYGDCKDKVALMRAMLQTVDIPSCPVLARTDRPVDPNVPSPVLFNHVILAVPLEYLGERAGEMPAAIDGCLFFDPTDEDTPPGWLSDNLNHARVLKLSEQDSTLTELSCPTALIGRRVYRAEVSLLDYYSLAGDVRVLDYGTRAFREHHERTTAEAADIIAGWRELLAESMQVPVISDVRWDADADSAWIDFHFTAESYLKLSGDYGLLNVDFFHPDEPFALKSKERIHPVWFGRAAGFETNITWTLPDSWTADEPPAVVIDSCETGRVHSEATLQDNGIRVVTSYNRTGHIEDAQEYASARSFYRSLRSAYETRLILTKK